jgi:radical SAM superfamily enzyme YgiQ (UPF0313 family)
MTDVLLINPGDQLTVFQGLATTATAKEPPIWCRLIASYLIGRYIHPSILDAEALNLSPTAVANIATMVDPKLLVVVVHGHQPSASTQKMPSAIATVKALKAALPETSVLLVGGHPAALPFESLQESGADFVCTGEGPITIFELAWAIKRRQPLREARGLAWVNGTDHVSSAVPHNILELDREMPGGCWDLLPMDAYRAYAHHGWSNHNSRTPYASLYTSLGCPYSCLRGDTVVNTIYGNKAIKDLIGQEVPVFTYDPETKRGLVATARNVRCYGKNKKLVRVAFTDGTHIDCTPDHKFLQFKWGNRKNQYRQWAVQAQDLKPGAHIKAIRFGHSGDGYPNVSWGNGSSKTHRLVAEWMSGKRILKTEHVHHVNHDKNDWRPENLEVHSDAKSHFSRHPEVKERMRLRNPAFNMTPEWRAKLTAAVTGSKRSAESKRRYSQAAFIREAAKPGRKWWTEPDGSYHLSQQPLSPQALLGKPKGLQWYTRPDGSTYYDLSARAPEDLKGRKTYRRQPMVNHRVKSVTPLGGLHDVYCLEVPDVGWFYANDVLVKNCSFCMIQTPFRQGDWLAYAKGNVNSYRMWAAETVLKEIETLVERYNVVNIRIDDEMFVLNERHVVSICDKVIERYGDRLNFWCYGRVDQTKEKFLEKMRQAGFKWLCLGIESMSEHVRDGVAKGSYGEQDIVDTVRRVQAHGINIIANYMFGLPDDTLESMRHTLDLALELRTEYVNFYATVAYPGSRLWNEKRAVGWQPPKDWLAWSFHSYEHEPLGTNTLTPAEVLAFRDAAFQRYMLDVDYLRLVRQKFGDEVARSVIETAAIKLPRQLLESKI